MRKSISIMLSLILMLCMVTSCEKTPDHLKIPDYSQYMTLGTYKNLEYSLLKTYTNEDEKNADIFDAVMIEIMNNSTYVSYPENRIARLVAIANETVEIYAQNNNMSVEDFLKKSYGFESIEAYGSYVRIQAQSYFEVRMTIFEIARHEKMTVTQEEYDAARAKLFAEAEMSEEEFNQAYDSEDILFQAVYPKVQAFLIANSVDISNHPTEATTVTATAESST